MRILVVDDHKDVAIALAAAVRVCRHEVIGVAASGIDAIQAYSRDLPDVVLMDYQMPRLNGATACRHILSKDPSARIVLFSGSVDPEEFPLAESGALAVLSKPFSTAKLRDLLSTMEMEPAAAA